MFEDVLILALGIFIGRVSHRFHRHGRRFHPDHVDHLPRAWTTPQDRGLHGGWGAWRG